MVSLAIVVVAVFVSLHVASMDVFYKSSLADRLSYLKSEVPNRTTLVPSSMRVGVAVVPHAPVDAQVESTSKRGTALYAFILLHQPLHLLLGGFIAGSAVSLRLRVHSRVLINCLNRLSPCIIVVRPLAVCQQRILMPCTGMQAMCVNATTHWNGGVIFASFLVAVIVASAAFYIIFRLLVWKCQDHVTLSALTCTICQ
jgi:hypothetical protein